MMYGTEIRFRILRHAQALFNRLVAAGFEVAIFDGWDDERMPVYDLMTDARVDYVDQKWVIAGEDDNV